MTRTFFGTIDHRPRMLVELALLLGGLALLLDGANTLVTEADRLALCDGVSTFFAGVGVISIGTSIPEMTTSLYAASYGAGALVADVAVSDRGAVMVSAWHMQGGGEIERPTAGKPGRHPSRL